MPKTRECTVLFADLRGSTALYETVGNAVAARVVTVQVASIADIVARCGGRVVKTLGDGLMAVFDTPAQGVRAAQAMHDMPARSSAVSHVMPPVVSSALSSTAPDVATLAPLKLQVALAAGEVVFVDDDCFGDAVNVAARLLDHADDNETLVTAAVLAGIDAAERVRFRSLGPMQLRGRAEPVHVCLLEAPSVADGLADSLPTVLSELEPVVAAPQGIRLTWLDLDRFYTAAELPLVLGRGTDADYRVDDSRVSRQHARIDAEGTKFQLNDLSYNGTYVCFANNAGVLSLRRGACLLHGSGIIALGTATVDALSPCIRFEVRH